MKQQETLIEVEDVPRKRILRAAVLPALVVLLLWVVFLLDHGLQLELYRYGILPRSWAGLPGILLSPFIHGDAEHVFNNSVPIFFLGWSLIYFYPRKAGSVVLVSWLASGIWVWISARGNYHVGASGVVYGLATFLFVSGMLRKQRTLMALSMLVVFLYGSMVWGVFPIVPRVSWESHLWGALSGVLMAILYRNVPPAVQDPKPLLLDDPDDDDGVADEQGQDVIHMPICALPSVSADPLRIVYHMSGADLLPPAAGGDEHEDPGNSRRMDAGNTSGTWSATEDYRP